MNSEIITASTFSRIGDFLFDNFIVFYPINSLSILFVKVLGLPDLLEIIIDLIIIIFFLFIYEPLLVSKFGGTFGHRYNKVKVTTIDGGRLTYIQALKRYFLKSLLGIISLILLLFSKKTIHDRLCKSYSVNIG